MYKDYYKKQQYTVRNEGYKDEPMLIIAEDSSGRIVHIKEVPNGLDCNCICPKCRQRLVAKNNKDNERQSHFAHYDSSSNCHGAYMSAIHKLAEQIIYEEKMVMAPAYGSIGNTKLVFTEVELEKRGDRSDLQPDLVGITADGKRWAIEIRYTNEIDSKKTKKIKESEMVCLEIDVRNQEQDKEKLKRFLTESTDYREWINNPLYDSIIAEEEKEKVNAIEKCLLNAKTLTIPSFESCNSKTIRVKDVVIMKKLEDIPLSIVKVVSRCGIPYLFYVSRKEILDAFTSSLKNFFCDTFKIPIDNVSGNGIIRLDNLELLWVNNYSANMIKNIIFYELGNKTPFSGKFISYCRNLPEYNPYIIENTFIKQVIDQHVSDLYSQIDNEEKQKIINYGCMAVEGRLDFYDDNNNNVSNRRCRTIDNYYSELKMSKTVYVEYGVSAKIINISKIGAIIHVLCEAPEGQRNKYYVYEFSMKHNEVMASKKNMFASIIDAKCVYLTNKFFGEIIDFSK